MRAFLMNYYLGEIDTIHGWQNYYPSVSMEKAILPSLFSSYLRPCNWFRSIECYWT